MLVADAVALDVSVRYRCSSDPRHRDKLKLTVLFITHNIGVVEYLCDRVVALSRGEIVERGRPDRDQAPHAYTQRLQVPRL